VQVKYKRHNKILEIISEYNIETQEELIEKLKDSGMDVTQATISRDIRDLKLVKISTDDNKYKYAVSQHDEIKISSKYRRILRETVVGVDRASNIVVFKTYPGMAQAAGAAVDGMGWGEIVGTIAGDDTIFVLIRDLETALEFVGKVRTVLKSE